MSKKEKSNDNKKTDVIIRIILVIIIILLLLQNCSLNKRKDNNESGKTNIIDIKCNDDNNCKQEQVAIDCLKDGQNSKCLIPNFVGKNKKDVFNWLILISNNIELEIKLVENPNYKDGTVLGQSIVGVSVKDLLAGRKKLVITIVNNGSLVDCQKDSQNAKCILPNFVDRKKSDVENWLDEIANNVKIKYVYVNSVKDAGTIVNQSIKSGSSIKDLLDKNETLIVYISVGMKSNSSDGSNSNNTSNNNHNNNNNSNNSGNNNGNNNSNTPEPEPEPELDNDFYVSDNKIVKWQNQTDLDIFEDSLKISKVRGKIAPESTGIYKFKVNNGTEYNLTYKISFAEENQHGMNLKFKLKKGNTYLINQYVSPGQLDIDNMILNSNKYDTYYLEWKWVGDDDTTDTSIGNSAKTNDIEYSLTINVEAESI